MKTEPKERPILFSAPMVRAILKGSKTQTRRIVKPQPWKDGDYKMSPGIDKFFEKQSGEWWGVPADVKNHDPSPHTLFRVRCPYGVPGDRLWVRETWSTSRAWNGIKPSELPEGIDIFYNASIGDDVIEQFKPYRPSIFMPRWASRLTLEIVNVRIERLQDISEEDAKAEGASADLWFQPVGKPEGCGRNLGAVGAAWNESWESISYRNGYANLWESINGPGSWAANPFVWVVEFRVAN